MTTTRRLKSPSVLIARTGDEADVERLLIKNGWVGTLRVFRAELEALQAARASRDLRNVTRDASGKYPCVLCSRTFAIKGSLARHINGVHRGRPQSHHCNLCPTTFARRQDLYEHMRRRHEADEEVINALKNEYRAVLRENNKDDTSETPASSASAFAEPSVSKNLETPSHEQPETKTTAAHAHAYVHACSSPIPNHQRFPFVQHDNHMDWLVDGSLHHINAKGECEGHGTIANLMDLDGFHDLLDEGWLHPPAETSASQGEKPTVNTGELRFVTHDCHLDLELPSGGSLCGASMSKQHAHLERTGHSHNHAHHPSISASHTSAGEAALGPPIAHDASNCKHPRIRHGDHVDCVVNDRLVYSGSAPSNKASSSWQDHGSFKSLISQNQAYDPSGDAETKLEALQAMLIGSGHSTPVSRAALDNSNAAKRIKTED